MNKKYYLYAAILVGVFVTGFLLIRCAVGARVKPLVFSPSDRPTESNFAAKAVAIAESMLGIPYDPLMGGFNNALGRRGFVVCIDVPVTAYENEGIPITKILKDSAREHPEWFEISPQNSPNNPYFYRRVRNYYPLFKNHPDLEASDHPRPGDWAFFGRFHIALVSSIGPYGAYRVVEANPHWLHVRISTQEYMDKTWGPAAFFGRIKNLKGLLNPRNKGPNQVALSRWLGAGE